MLGQPINFGLKVHVPYSLGKQFLALSCLIEIKNGVEKLYNANIVEKKTL